MAVVREKRMENNMKMRAQLKDGVVTVKVLMSHSMETGRRKDDGNQLISAHFVQTVIATLNGKTVMEAQWGTGIAKNPYLTFKLKQAKVDDIVAITWLDNLGQTVTQSIAVTNA